ncbi:MAG: lysylphosphatidylglycerol synthase transmembrane domain-containing protein [Minicystis sp.]
MDPRADRAALKPGDDGGSPAEAGTTPKPAGHDGGSAPKPPARLARTLIRLVGPALLVLVIARMKDPGALVRAVAAASFAPLAIAILLNLVNIHLKVIRWDIILRTRGIVYPRRRAWASFMTSLYVGLLTPGRVGDVLRAQYLKHEIDVPYAEGIASVVVDRLCDLYVLAAFVAVGVVRYAPVIVGSLAFVTWAGVAATVLGPLLLLIPGVAEAVLGRAFAKFSPDKDGAGFTRFLEAVRANVGKPLLLTIPLTIATFVINYLQGYLIAHAIGLPMSFFDATCLLAIASLLGLLPISVSGVGVRELFFALAFPMLGFSAEAGVGFGLLVFFVIYLVIVFVGFVSWQIAPPPSASGVAPARAPLTSGRK